MNEKKRRKEERIFDEYFENGLVQSATDMTGLTPTPPLTESEEESYSQLKSDAGFGLPRPLQIDQWTHFL